VIEDLRRPIETVLVPEIVVEIEEHPRTKGSRVERVAIVGVVHVVVELRPLGNLSVVQIVDEEPGCSSCEGRVLFVDDAGTSCP